MSSEIKNTISTLLSESSSYNSNDVLVNALADNNKLFITDGKLEFRIDEFPSVILKDALRTNKQSGVNSLCLSHGIIELTINNSTTHTPLFLTPINHKVDKVRGIISFLLFEEELFVNPFVIHHLQSTLGVEIDEKLLASSDKESWYEFIIGIGFHQIDSNTSYIGNFHHHRYQILKELDELLKTDRYSNSLLSIFGANSLENLNALPVFKGNLFPADPDHENVFNQLVKSNMVIQGPPGTGKSQVLSNIVGKMMHDGRSALVLSEKRAALEVIQKRLAVHGLDKLCFIATSDEISKAFLSDLKKTWDYFENYHETPINNLFVSEQLEDNLQMTLDLLSQEKLIGDVSFQEFHALTKDINLIGKYTSQLPSIPIYLENEETIQCIYQNSLNISIGSIKLRIFQGENFHDIDKKIAAWKTKLAELNQVFDITAWSNLTEIMQKAADCQIFENDLFKSYSKLFKPNSKAQRRFISLRKKLKKIELENKAIQDVSSHWKKRPSLLEVESILKSLKRSSWLKRVSLKKRWKELSNLDITEAQIALEKYKEEINRNNALSQIKIDFCDIGIDNPDIDVDLIYQTLHQFTAEKWALYESYDPQKRAAITNKHRAINELWHDLKNHFLFDNNTNLSDFFDAFEKDLAQIVVMHHKIASFDSSLLYLIRTCYSHDELREKLYTGHWIVFKERFPTFAAFKIGDIKSKVEKIISNQEIEANLLAKKIEQIAYNRFKDYHAILTTPAQKLSQDEKDLKKRLRKGKSLLVKEFSKTRSHPSLRELYNSDAKEWIQALKPIWLSNPTQLAKCFPLESELFDLCIFDEASQIPIQNAIGALQRSKRVVVAGDEHQMGPMNYFKSGSKEEVDLLHQANYYWEKTSLSHHYRSSHPDLIKFSNKHFYNNQLVAYPSYPSSSPIQLHYVKEGQFIERKNVKEAEFTAQQISQALKTQDDVGIVAFSEEQLSCIWNQLSSVDQQAINERIANNLGFFKSVENVQGDECDHLIISFGYAKNEEGEFNMRFGPMNTENGRKRLNVLLTRSRKSIEFITSVKSTDFKLTDNESVHLIQKWFQFIENYQTSNAIEFPSQLLATSIKNQLTLQYTNNQIITVRDLVTLQNVLTQRGWNINYI